MKRLIFLAALVGGCSSDVPDTPVDTSAPAAPAVMAPPGTFTLDDFRRLHWIAGRWRGTMPDGKSFYEQYRVVNDSTIEMSGHTDSTFAPSTDGSRIMLRDKRVVSESATSRYVATRLDSAGVDFTPERGRNAFTWARESDARWTATLRWTDAQGQPQTVVYPMQRIGR